MPPRKGAHRARPGHHRTPPMVGDPSWEAHVLQGAPAGPAGQPLPSCAPLHTHQEPPRVPPRTRPRAPAPDTRDFCGRLAMGGLVEASPCHRGLRSRSRGLPVNGRRQACVQHHLLLSKQSAADAASRQLQAKTSVGQASWGHEPGPRGNLLPLLWASETDAGARPCVRGWGGDTARGRAPERGDRAPGDVISGPARQTLTCDFIQKSVSRRCFHYD